MQPQVPSPLHPAHWQQTDRLATIGTLTAGVAHELNNPIGYILSNLTSFQHYLPLFTRYFDLFQALLQCDNPAKQAELHQQLTELQQQESLQFLLDDTRSLLADSVQGALRVRDLVLDLRRFSHPDHAELQELELRPLLEMAMRLTKNELKNRVRVELHCAAEPIVLQGQPAALTQVFVNIIVNAVQAIQTAEGRLHISVTLNAEWLQIAFEDNGPGVSPEMVAQIFEPFFTTKPPGTGTGLGLAICRAIVGQHQGSISLQPSTLGGAAFVVRLPAKNNAS